MNTLLIRPSKTTPLIWLDPTGGTGMIVGNSMPENAAEFYSRVLHWLDENLPAIEQMRWVIRLVYFNTSSTKGIYQILSRIRIAMDQGQKHQLQWDVEANDEFMREAGENFMQLLDLPLVFRELDEEEAMIEDEKLRSQVDRLEVPS